MVDLITISILLTVTSAVWTDPGDLSFDGRLGMKIYTVSAPHIDRCVDETLCKREYSHTTANTYYGPFDSSEKFKLMRTVACSKKSTLVVKFKVGICNGDDDHTDHATVYIGSIDISPRMYLNDTHTSISKDVLDHLGCTEYRVQKLKYKPDIVVAAEYRFPIEIKIKVDDDEIVYVWSIKVKCCETDEEATLQPYGGYIDYEHYCVSGLPGGNETNGEFSMRTDLSQPQEDPIYHNGYFAFEKNDLNGDAFLHSSTMMDDDEYRWQFTTGSDNINSATMFAHCDNNRTSLSHSNIVNDCGCFDNNVAQECDNVYDVDDNLLDGVYIAQGECQTGHVVIESVPLSTDIDSLWFYMIDIHEYKWRICILLGLCASSFILGMLTLYVCQLVKRHKHKSYDKVINNDCEVDKEDELDF